jgi:hypothetical protein
VNVFMPVSDVIETPVTSVAVAPKPFAFGAPFGPPLLAVIPLLYVRAPGAMECRARP